METIPTCPHCGGSLHGDEACPVCSTPGGTTAAEPTMIPPPPVFGGGQPVSALPYGGLQHALVYAGMARTLRGIGIGNIVWGVILLLAAIGLFVGISGASGRIDGVSLGVAAVFAVFALAFVAEGIWLMVAPSATGLLVAAITMFVIAALELRLLLVAIVLIAYGVTLLRRYRKYGPLMAERPAPPLLQQARELLETLRRSSYKRSPDVIEFGTSGALTRQIWRGLRQGDTLIFVNYEIRLIGRSIAEVIFLPVLGMAIETRGKQAVGKWLKATLYVDDRQVNGVIPPECFARYEAWRQERLQGAERTTNATHGGAESEYPEHDVPV